MRALILPPVGAPCCVKIDHADAQYDTMMRHPMACEAFPAEWLAAATAACGGARYAPATCATPYGCANYKVYFTQNPALPPNWHAALLATRGWFQLGRATGAIIVIYSTTAGAPHACSRSAARLARLAAAGKIRPRPALLSLQQEQEQRPAAFISSVQVQSVL